MKEALRTALGILAWLLFLAASPLPGGTGISPDRLEEKVLELTREPHRLAGTAAGDRAVREVEEALRGLPGVVLMEQHFSLPVHATEGVLLSYEREGETVSLPLHPLRPNGLVPPALPEEGLEGVLLTRDAFLEGGATGTPAVVVLPYGEGDSWREMFRLGALAVVFTGDGGAGMRPVLHALAPGNLPRYYYEGPIEALPLGLPVRLEGDLPVSVGDARNLFAWIPGDGSGDGKGYVLVSAPLDSFGEVPGISPAARQAANVALLTAWIRNLALDPPSRPVLAAFLHGESRGHAGSRAFYSLFAPEGEAIAPGTRERRWERESEHLAELAGALDSGTWRDSEVANAVRLRLRAVADEATNELRRLQRQARLNPGTFSEEQLAEWETRRLAWSDFKRVLKDGAGWETVEDQHAHEVAEVLEDLADRREELRRERGRLDEARDLLARIGQAEPLLHLSLDFGDPRHGWSPFVDTGSQTFRNREIVPTLLGSQAAIWDRSFAEGGGASGFAGYRPISENNRLLYGDVLSGLGPSTSSGVVAGLLGIPHLALRNWFDPRPREGTPFDTAAQLDFEGMAAQGDAALELFRGVLRQSALEAPSPIRDLAVYAGPEMDSRMRLFGPRVFSRDPLSGANERPVADALVWITGSPPVRLPSPASGVQPDRIPAFEDFFTLDTDSLGSYRFGPFFRRFSFAWGYAARFDEAGRMTAISSEAELNRVHERMTVNAVHPLAMAAPPVPFAEPVNLFSAVGHSRIEPDRRFLLWWDGLLVAHFDRSLTRFQLFGERSFSLLGMGNEAEATQLGAGWSVEQWRRSGGQASRHSAGDLLELTRDRLERLRGQGLYQEDVEEWWERASRQMDESAQTASPPLTEALAAEANWIALRAYRAVKGIYQDLVRSVLVLLLMTIPFAFAAERLFIGSPRIYGQIAGFMGFFLAAFLLLYWSHPAFAIAATPIVIFLGFIIVLLSALVIALVLGKFEEQLKYLQGEARLAHTVDVSRFGTLGAAMLMGISTMRRRPLRTGLTLVTILLLTFTLLTFASFGSRQGWIRLAVEAPDDQPRVLFQYPDRRPVSEGIRSYLFESAESAPAHVRWWLRPDPENPDRPVAAVQGGEGTEPVLLQGIIGLEEGERLRRPDLRALLDGSEKRADQAAVWLPDSIARRLAVEPGGKLVLSGIEVRLAGTFAASALDGVVDAEGFRLLPDLPAEDRGTGGRESGTEALTRVSAVDLRPLSPGRVAVVTAGLALELGAAAHQVTVYPDDHDRAGVLSETWSRALGLPVTGSREGGMYRHVYGQVLAASGGLGLLLPVVLGGLVIFGTLLGSVSDRQGEIQTFSALGLAPAHVAGLFLAEALVYALLGGLGGYYLSQLLHAALHAMASLGWVPMPEMNFSSFNAVLTLLTVMAIVLLSAVYPAWKASRSANPGIQRAWRPPAPDGDTLRLVFPFTVSGADVAGIFCYLKEFFDTHADSGTGVLLSEYADLRPSGEGVELEAGLAIAPFDLGVTQEVTLSVSPSEVPGVDEVHLRIRRRSGREGDWLRLNRRFLQVLRQQFLLWRALPGEQVARYCREGEKEVSAT